MTHPERKRKRVYKRPAYLPKRTRFEDDSNGFNYWAMRYRSYSWNELCHFARDFGLRTQSERAEFLCVTVRTLQRWTEVDKAPRWAWRMMMFRTCHLGAIFPEWKGWRIIGDELIDADGVQATRHIIECCQFLGTPVVQAQRRQQEAEQRARELEDRLVLLTECLAGFLVVMQKPRIDETFTVYTEKQQPPIQWAGLHS